MKRFLTRLTVMLSALLPTLAGAGSTENAQQKFAPAAVAIYAQDLQKDLAARGANVAIVARVGRDRKALPTGVSYTHVAYWVYSEMTRKDGSKYKGYRAYNLYQSAEDGTVSQLIEDSPASFFAGAYVLDAGVIIPDPRLQKKLLATIKSPSYARLHNTSYSVLANPMTSRFQNCTEYTLDVLMASIYATENKHQIKANIAAHFEPQPIKISGFKRLLAPASSAALTTADHGAQINTATFSTIARFMASHNLSDQIYRFTERGAVPF